MKDKLPKRFVSFLLVALFCLLQTPQFSTPAVADDLSLSARAVMKKFLQRHSHPSEEVFLNSVPGELIVKLKEGHTLAELDGLKQKYRILSDEPVFPPVVSPQESLAELKKQRTALENPDHSGWYWWSDKESKESKDYETRIAQQKENLDKAIKNKEQLIDHLQARQQRAPEGSSAPSLEGIHLLRAAEDADIPLLVNKFQDHPAVAYAEPNYEMKINALPNDTYVDPDGDGDWETAPWIPASSSVIYEALWGVRKIEADRAWDLFAQQGTQPGFERAGHGVVVAIIDTGIDYRHPDLAANIWPGLGHDFVNNDDDPMDDNGHGSHCAGTIGAVGGNGIGIIGIAPGVQLMAVKGLNAEGSGSNDHLAQCVRYATDNGADILSNSWGGQGTSSLFNEVFSYAQAHGVICVAAAGNNNASVNGFTPANVPGVITVGASDSHDQKASFSNWGARVDLSAPGGGVASELGGNDSDIRNILSTLPEGVTISENHELQVSEGYYRLAGTSMACPHVSGAAALVLARRPGTRPDEMRTRLRATADAYPVAPSVPLGTGRLNAYRAVDAEPFPFIQVIGSEQTEGAGNGDGMIEAGEELRLVVKVKNFWASASNVSVTVRLPEGTPLSVVSGFTQLGTLAAGEQKENSDQPLVLKVRDDFRLTGEYPVLFDLLADGHLRTVSGSVRLGVLFLPLPEGANPSLARLSGQKLVYQDDRRLNNSYHDLYEYDLSRKVERLLLAYPGTPEEEDIRIDELAYENGKVILDRMHLPLDVEDYQRTLTLLRSDNGREKTIVRLRQPSDPDSSPLDFPYHPVFRDGRLAAIDYGTVRGQIVQKGLAVRNVSAQGSTSLFLKEDFDGRGVSAFDLSGNRLVAAAQDETSGRTDILLYDMTTRQSQTIASESRPLTIVSGLSVDGNFVAWSTIAFNLSIGPPGIPLLGLTFNFQIFVHDLRSHVTRVLARVDNGSFFSFFSPPFVRDGWVVWADPRADPAKISSDIYLYDLSTDREIRFVSSSKIEHDPGISDGLVYWQEGIRLSKICLAKLPESHPPVLDPLTQQTVDEEQLLSFTLHATDPDGGQIRFLADSLPRGASLDPETGLFSWTPDYTQAGSYPVIFRADDNRASVTQSVSILVRNIPRPPVLAAIPDKSVNENMTLSFTISATDPDGEVISYSADDLPDGAQFNSAQRRFSWKPNYNQSGFYVVKFIAKDPGNLADSEVVQITVNHVNRPPGLNSIGVPGRGGVALKGVRATRTLTFTVNGSDPDGDALTFSASGLPAGASFDPQTRTFSWTPTARQGGVYNVVFRVSDGIRTDSQTINIIVTA